MSTAETQTSDPAGASPRDRQGRKIFVGLLCGLLLAFLGLMAMSLLAAQRTESQRQEVGIAGGRCKFERRSPTWLKPVLGDSVPSFLRYPVIFGVTLTGQEVNDESLAMLPDLPELRTLDLEDSQVTSDGLRFVTQWKKLRELDLGNTPVTEITTLNELPLLETLQLNFSQVRREYLAGISQLENLKILAAGYLQITNPEVVEIAKCPHLEELSIAAADLGEEGLQPLISLKELHTLVLQDAKYEPADLQAFQEARPNVTIIK